MVQPIRETENSTLFAADSFIKVLLKHTRARVNIYVWFKFSKNLQSLTEVQVWLKSLYQLLHIIRWFCIHHVKSVTLCATSADGRFCLRVSPMDKSSLSFHLHSQSQALMLSCSMELAKWTCNSSTGVITWDESAAPLLCVHSLYGKLQLYDCCPV